jgi:hypothetical protein
MPRRSGHAAVLIRHSSVLVSFKATCSATFMSLMMGDVTEE